jgi:hypothetical protein
MPKPSLELAVEVTGADGTQRRWGPGARAGEVPQGLSFRTKQAEGFADANLTLARRVDRDYVDLHLLDSVVISGADGTIAYEGRVSRAPPRSMQDTHTGRRAGAGGWRTPATARPSEIYVDRDLGAWGTPSQQRRRAVAANYGTPTEGVTVTDNGGRAALKTSASRPVGSGPAEALECARLRRRARLLDRQHLLRLGARRRQRPSDGNWRWGLTGTTDD